MKLLRLYFLGFLFSSTSCVVQTNRITGQKIKTFDLAAKESLTFVPEDNRSFHLFVVNKSATMANLDLNVNQKTYEIRPNDTLKMDNVKLQDLKFSNSNTTSTRFTIFVQLDKQQFSFPKEVVLKKVG
ncbi:hypothetical protein [Sphingobacterium bovistauri]|uniref:Lipoprotein n=1 Tax=Sphingobacterium bovistauri TaxID=2781959 RepID=A0ABS7Z0P3_9SPHI|nr:hypothetical protein [Sphingobacterium bovistauri]MCA5003735.1 hypothetical protein [Sphingobacterium bovistauri]